MTLLRFKPAKTMAGKAWVCSVCGQSNRYRRRYTCAACHRHTGPGAKG